jgi:hypothetical protein
MADRLPGPHCTSNPRAMIFAAIFGILGRINAGDP